MTLKCRPGDLAMYMGSVGPRGFPTNVIRAYDRPWPYPCWYVNPPIPDLPGVLTTGLANVIADRDLKPIRPGNGEDEVLRIAGKPTETVRELIKELAR